MPNFKIATWNVNSVRVRLPHLLAWLNQAKPDVLAIQELKLEEALFPYQQFADIGYHAIVSGQKTYNGVAILSREAPQDAIKDMPGFNDPQRRLLAATIGNMRVLNLYVPNGENISSDKFHYKLNWLKNLEAFIRNEQKNYSEMLILGDFNIAPSGIDVHDPILWEGCVLFSKEERGAFQNILNLGFSDCFRALSPNVQTFSWWDYRMNAFKRNLGLRIDHILTSMNLKKCLTCSIDKQPRSWERPSDHAPVIAEFVL